HLLDGLDVAWDDVFATLTELTAVTVADACRARGVAEVIASGGGVRNPALMAALRARLDPAPVRDSAELGLDGDAKEAYLFALLGFLTWQGLPSTVPSCTGASHPVLSGRLSRPAPHATLPSGLRVLPEGR